MHRVYCQTGIPQAGQRLTLSGDEAVHAGVKRLEVGEAIEVLDGAGMVAAATVESQRPSKGRQPAELVVVIGEVRNVARAKPVLHVRSATPKGDRLDGMIEQLSQVGAASWGPLATARGVVDPRETKLERLNRVAIAASKQCGVPYLLRIEPKVDLDQLVACAGPAGVGKARLVVAAAGGESWNDGGEEEVVLAIGPEGDWTEQELERLRTAGARVCNFGPHVMRIETAAVAACAVIMARAMGRERR